jgi:hypothetical protein
MACGFALLLTACSKQDISPVPQATDMSAATINQTDAQVAHSWLTLQLKFIKEDARFTPPVASRSLGYAGITLYETVVGKMPQYRSIASQIGAPEMPRMPNDAVDEALAANKALHDLLISFFTYTGNARNNEVQLACQQLYQQNLEVFSANVPPSKIKRSTDHGAAVAAAVYAWSATDPIGHEGQLHNTDPSYIVPAVPGAWQPTPPAYAPPVQPHWGGVRTFSKGALGGLCLPVDPIPFSTEVGSPFYNQAMEVYQVYQNLTAEQSTIATYWADGGGTITPPGHMVSIAMQVLQQERASLAQSALAYCKVGMAVNDAFVSCWKAKYVYVLMRPVTYIRAYIDPNWLPHWPTPPFPSYGSGHATQSGAACQVLSDLFGNDYAFTDHTNDYLGFAPRSFSSFFDAAEEAAISRLYGGIHYTMDNENAYAAGINIGKEIRKIRFEK